jgi:CDP-glycerol glycerophosphotransferase (TagB/SpsB family)
VKILNSKNVRKFTLTFLNVLKIFLISFLKSYKEKSTRFVFFYFPVKAYQENIVALANLLNKNSNISVYLIYNSLTSDELKSKKNSIFIDFGYLRFIPFVNFFLSKINLLISSYVIYIFLPNTKNIYISHDIYDTPMVNKAIEKDLFSSLSRLDYIFVSSNIVKKYFENSFKKYLKLKKTLKKTEIVNTGYLKLDHITNILEKTKKNINKLSILIAPTASKHYAKYNLSSNLDNMINFLLKKKYQIIYRPHPLDLTEKGNYNLVKKVINKYQKFENFKSDMNPSYLNSYANSNILITDFSGTAYTYAFSKDSPVIFFSTNKNRELNNTFTKLHYFKDRNKIGYIVNNFLDLDKKLTTIKKKKYFFSYQIKKLKKKRIQYIGLSLNKTKETMLQLLK